MDTYGDKENILSPSLCDDTDFDLLEASQDLFNPRKVMREKRIVRPWEGLTVCGPKGPSRFDVTKKINYSSGSSNSSHSHNNSRNHPRYSEESIPDILCFQSVKFVASEATTDHGIEYLFNKLIGIITQIKRTSTPQLMLEYVQILSLIEHIAIKEEVNDTKLMYRLITRLLCKVGNLYDAVDRIRTNQYMNNSQLHVCLYAWRCAYRILSNAPLSFSQSLPKGSTVSLEDVLIVIATSLVLLKEKSGELMPCCCTQYLLEEIYQSNSSMFIKELFGTLRICVEKKPIELSYKQSALSMARSSTLRPISFLEFTVDLISYFIEIGGIEIGTDEQSSRLLQLFGMAELLAESIVEVCEQMYRFLNIHPQLSGWEKLRKSSKTLWTRVSLAIDDISLLSLNKLASGDDYGLWAREITSCFRNVHEPEINLIRLMMKMMSQQPIWENLRSIIYNRYTAGLGTSHSLATVLTLLMGAVASAPDAMEVGDKLCDWMSVSFEKADSMGQQMLFNAALALQDVLSSRGETKDNSVLLTNFLNKLSLPLRSELFVQQYIRLSVMGISLHSVDMGRICNLLRPSDLSELIKSLKETDVEVPMPMWEKAVVLMTASGSTRDVTKFVVKQIRLSLEQSRSTLRITRMLDRFNSKGGMNGDLLFEVCNSVLALPRSYPVAVVRFVPLWIYAVLAFRDSHELQLNELTSSVWALMSDNLKKIDQSIHMSMSGSQDSPEHHLERLLEVLGKLWSKPVHSVKNNVRELVNSWFTVNLAQMVEQLMNKQIDDVDTQRRISKFGSSLLYHISGVLMSLAEAARQKQGFNTTPCVIFICTFVDQICKRSFPPEHLYVVVPRIVYGLASLPHHLFVLSRLKSILVKYSDNDTICRLCVEQIRRPECKAYLIELCDKEKDVRIKAMFTQS